MFRGLLPALLLSSACAGVPVAPDWYGQGVTCDESRTLPEGGHRYCATATGETEEAALKAARDAALARAASSIVTSIASSSESESICEAVERSGGTTATCEERVSQRVSSSTRAMAFRDVPTERKRVERDGHSHQAWVAVRIEAAQRDRLRRAAMGKTLVAVDCRLGAGACPASILDQLTTALSTCGLAKAGGFVTDVDSAERAVKRALEADAGRALLVSLRADAASADGGLALSAAQGRWELFDSDDGRTLAARGLPAREVPGRNAEAAMQSALKASIDRLAAPSCGMAESKGSLCCIDLETGAPRL